MRLICISVFVLIAFLSSCEEEKIDLRDPCDFVISTEEVAQSTNICEGCSFRFSFRGKLYDFHQDRINLVGQCLDEGECERYTIAYHNDFFEFELKYMHRSRDLFFSMNELRALLTPDSLRKTDFNFLQPSLLLKDRCGVHYQVAENTSIYFPDVSNNTITDISLLRSSIIDNGAEPTEYVTFYLVSGNFKSRILIGNDSEAISGSYTLRYAIIEPL